MEYNKKRDILKKAVNTSKMYDVGKSLKITPLKKLKSIEKIYPALHLSGEQAPFLSECSVGEKKKLIIEVVMVAKEEYEGSRGEKTNYSFDIKKVGLAK